jgi:hypothetical protein
MVTGCYLIPAAMNVRFWQKADTRAAEIVLKPINILLIMLLD